MLKVSTKTWQSFSPLATLGDNISVRPRPLKKASVDRTTVHSIKQWCYQLKSWRRFYASIPGFLPTTHGVHLVRASVDPIQLLRGQH